MGKKKNSRIATLRRRLLVFYDGNQRELPWRGETDPYRVWVSEIMLQQTRVDTVIPYYEKWVQRFPDLTSLAEAEEDEVLRAWQGLGYYSRARRLHQGALMVRERFGGTLPRSSEGLRELPGVGEYTAGAVASIAYNEAVPAVDGNVRRVLSRLYDLPNPSPAKLREVAGALVDPARPGDFNQALMELGATVCAPRNPRCHECPVRLDCQALERGTVARRPVRKEKPPVPEVEITVVVAVARDQAGRAHFLLRKRPADGLLAGMWEFPGVEVAGEDRGMSDTSEQVMELSTVTHAFSHLRARYKPYIFGPLPGEALDWSSGRVEAGLPMVTGCSIPSLEGGRWISDSGTSEIPLPVAQQKILRHARTHLGL